MTRTSTQASPALAAEGHFDQMLTADDFKAAFRNHPAGVSVVTADPGDGPVGLTAGGGRPRAPPHAGDDDDGDDVGGHEEELRRDRRVEQREEIVDAVAEAAGGSLKDIVKLNIFLTDHKATTVKDVIAAVRAFRDAEKLRNHILRQFEPAASENDLAKRQPLLR